MYEYSTSTSASTSGEMNPIVLAIYAVIGLVMIVSMWRVFTKAGRPGWAVLIPFYNTYTLLKIAGRPGWWLLLFFIPVVNLVLTLILSLDVAKSFGRSSVFGFFGLFLFGFVGYPILGFGKDQYVGPAGADTTPTMTTPPTPPTPPTV